MTSALRSALVAAVLLLAPFARADVPEKESIPVVLDGQTVFHVRNPLGPFTAEERAAAAEARLLRLAEDPFYSPDLFSVTDHEDATTILYGDTVVASVTDADAAVEGASREEVASEGIARLKGAIAAYHERRHPAAERRGWLAVGLTVLGFLGFIAFQGFLHRRIDRFIDRSEAIGIPKVLRPYLSIPPQTVKATLKAGLHLARLAVSILVALIGLQVAFYFFPLTRGYALSILSYVTDPLNKLWHGFLGSIADLLAAAVLITLVVYFLKVLRRLFDAVAAGKIEIPWIAREWATPVHNLVRIVVIVLAVVMVFPYIPGSDTAAFKGISLFAGALFTLGASGTIGNFLGGLVVMFVGAFRLGDFVKIGETTGDVVDTTLVLTRLRTPWNEIVTVPNSAILTGQVINYTAEARNRGVILRTSVTIGYDAPWRKVHELLLAAASRTPKVETEPAPFVLQTALNDFFITYQINAYTRSPSAMPWIYSDLHRNIQDAFNEAGVEIMSPHFSALRDGNTIAIPEASRKGPENRKFEVRVDKP